MSEWTWLERASVYLKAVTPIRVNSGYEPHIFIADYDEKSHTYCGWRHKQPLRVGDDRTLNTIELVNSEDHWIFYSREAAPQGRRPLNVVLGAVGFIGVMYHKGPMHTGVGATGVLGIDDFCYGLPPE